jgi:hypothetical protein
MLPTKAKRQHIKQGSLDKIAGFIKPDGLLSVTPYVNTAYLSFLLLNRQKKFGMLLGAVSLSV